MRANEQLFNETMALADIFKQIFVAVVNIYDFVHPFLGASNPFCSPRFDMGEDGKASNKECFVYIVR
jgi:hypothetical protein